MFIDEMKRVLGEERKQVVRFLRLLMQVEQTKAHLEAGFSLYALCTKELRLPRSATLKRINAARVASRFPEVLDLLESGEIHLSALVMLSPHLTEDNRKELFGFAATHSERKLERWLAGKFPKKSTGPKEKLEWLDGEKAELTLTIDSELLELVERTKELMKHQHPTGDTASVLKDVLKKNLKSMDPLQRKTRKASPKRSVVHSRVIPRRIKTLVWKRDNGQCAYLSPTGKRCEERAGLEIDHRQAWAHGGRSDDPSNLRLLCFAHNRWLGIKTFGKRFDSRPLPGA